MWSCHITSSRWRRHLLGSRQWWRHRPRRQHHLVVQPGVLLLRQLAASLIAGHKYPRQTDSRWAILNSCIFGVVSNRQLTSWSAYPIADRDIRYASVCLFCPWPWSFWSTRIHTYGTCIGFFLLVFPLAYPSNSKEVRSAPLDRPMPGLFSFQATDCGPCICMWPTAAGLPRYLREIISWLRMYWLSFIADEELHASEFS